MLKDDIKRGLALEDIDQAIRAVERQKARKPLELEKDEEVVRRIRKEWEEMKTKVATMRSEIRNAEGGLKEFDEKINKLTIQSNTVKKNDEYQAIMREISAVRAEKSLTEDKLIEFYERVEKTDGTVKEKEKEVRAAEEEFDKRRKAVEAEVADLERQIAEIRPRRESLSAEMDKDFLAFYERIAAAKEDAVVFSEAVEVKDLDDANHPSFFCHSCQMEITSQDVHLVKLSKNIIPCKSCSRILHLPA